MPAHYRAAKSVARDRKEPPVERREARVPDRNGAQQTARRQVYAVCAKVCRAASPAAHGASQAPAFRGAPLPSFFGSMKMSMPRAQTRRENARV